MAYPGQKRGTCDDIMAFFDSHAKCACCEKGIGVEKKQCEICDIFLNIRKDSKPHRHTGPIRSSRNVGAG